MLLINVHQLQSGWLEHWSVEIFEDAKRVLYDSTSTKAQAYQRVADWLKTKVETDEFWKIEEDTK